MSKIPIKATAEMTAKLLIIGTVCLLFSCKSVIPDGQLRSSISDRLLATPGMTSVTVSVENGVAKLTGTVSTDADKSLAESLAKIEGITSIENRITITPPPPETTIDAETAEEPPSLYEEAQLEAERYWNGFIFHCGESDFIYSHRPADPNVPSRYYDKPLDIFYEMRNFNVTTDGHVPTPKSEADRLNDQDSPSGIEWSGKTSVYASPMRIYLSQDTPDAFTSNGWNKWREESDPVFKVEMSKRNGKWSFGELRAQGAHGLGPLKKATCQQIPSKESSTSVPQIQAPQNQTNDISETYAKVGNVIYNKKKMTVFSRPSQFFADSGKTSFDGLKYDVQSQLPSGLKFVDGRKLTPEDYQKLR